ncbi:MULTISPECIES: hypothetical protein [Natrialba]|uniref:Uncharacterized protein n=2 Tax=Natrialba TaxID=63742 RepID=M0AMS3_NATA1|nr:MULTISPECIES: hypothetical protein [Natrialba]ELY89905.1 hypothetical protein C484_12921 [Natrialba taiwanensis DSM 12281]ELY98683.1 hypothetical protein C481_17202 [Natrialba asiatica DSM 12278]
MELNSRRLQSMYVLGILLNAVALVASATSGELLYAGTFGLIMCYLGLRLWMVA